MFGSEGERGLGYPDFTNMPLRWWLSSSGQICRILPTTSGWRVPAPETFLPKLISSSVLSLLKLLAAQIKGDGGWWLGISSSPKGYPLNQTAPKSAKYQWLTGCTCASRALRPWLGRRSSISLLVDVKGKGTAIPQSHERTGKITRPNIIISRVSNCFDVDRDLVISAGLATLIPYFHRVQTNPGKMHDILVGCMCFSACVWIFEIWTID
jgi:hypothetical protein